MGLNFGAHDDVVFARAPLKTVLCQIRFPPVLSLLTQAGVTGFQTGLRDHYPKMLPAERHAEVELAPDRVGVKSSAPVWRFKDGSETWTLSLAADFVALETPSYSEIDEFLVRLRRILKVLHVTIRPADSLRIGFRKVNLIRLPNPRQTTSLTGIVRSELIGPLSVQEFPAPISSSSSYLEFKDDLNTLAVRSGLGSDEDTKESSKELDFVIDMDFFTEQPRRIDGTDELIDFIRYLSDGMTSFFHWALLGPYKATLEPRSRKDVSS